jgi:hypothetical protein
METTYINSFDNFIPEDNRILVEDDALTNANHILILMNTGKRKVVRTLSAHPGITLFP